MSPTPAQTVWLHPEDPSAVQIIDQRWLPWRLEIETLKTLDDAATAIHDMHVRGAPLIGVVGAYGMYLAAASVPAGEDLPAFLRTAYEKLLHTRPTAVNLQWALDQQLKLVEDNPHTVQLATLLLKQAQQIKAHEIEVCKRIGQFGLPLIQRISERKNGAPVNILTHCNAGWLACVEHGTATAPIYLAHERGIPVHVWVDETRPRNQGARLTAWELEQAGVPHTVIPDNTGGHLMQHGKVDLCIVGTDRTTRRGDVANKIGTYLKALAAYDNRVPFYVALPSSTIDWSLDDGIAEIPIEQRAGEEVSHIWGATAAGQLAQVRLVHENAEVANFGFDVTPARLITGLITDRGVCAARAADLAYLFNRWYQHAFQIMLNERDPKKPLDLDTVRDEGYVKYESRWTETDPPQHPDLAKLIQYRDRLRAENLIGVYDDGVGFGNISVRNLGPGFVISGTQTGALLTTQPVHYSLVSAISVANNWVASSGRVPASSESLTHHMFYQLDAGIGAVIHVHNPAAWAALKGKVPTSKADIPYGTPEMAMEIERLFKEENLKAIRFMAMAGHDDGLIAFGKDLPEAYDVLKTTLRERA